jgi:hypothetical protein
MEVLKVKNWKELIEIERRGEGQNPPRIVVLQKKKKITFGDWNRARDPLTDPKHLH